MKQWGFWSASVSTVEKLMWEQIFTNH